MRLAGAGPADRDDVGMLDDEAAAGEIAHQPLVDRMPLNSKASTSLASGSFAMVGWCFINRR
jgi:hypothetical protein